MQWVILIVIAIGYVIVQGFNSASESVGNYQSFNEERKKKYGDRIVDTTKTLFERNQDIIEGFLKNIKTHSPTYNYSRRYGGTRYYYLENETRDCINEIALAEGKSSVRPESKYLSDWKGTAPSEWATLADQIKDLFSNKQLELQTEEKRVNEERQKIHEEKERTRKQEEEERNRLSREVRTFNSRKTMRRDPLLLRQIHQLPKESDLCVDDITDILTPNTLKWSSKEDYLIHSTDNDSMAKYPLFESEIDKRAVKHLNDDINAFNAQLEADMQAVQENKKFFQNILTGYKNKNREDVISRLNFVMNNIQLPGALPKAWNVDFNSDQSIAIVEVSLPDVVHKEITKEVQLKSGKVKKPLNQKELKEIVPKIHPSIILRTAYEIFRDDISNTIKLLVVNGWVEFNNPATGRLTKTYTASLVAEKDQIMGLNLKKLDPLLAFAELKGKSAGKLIDIIPVTPMMSLDKKDKRFIATKEVLNNLSTETNLAAMDWQDFENLIAELFQREFSEEGTEIKLTQSSRDKGVDAIVFNPDPIRGGKYVIQAKRYTNTVDVSAVRDLVAVVAHEGASRGILVTTSTFGADAYAFVQGKPITLLDGAKLLGLLEKHNYKFRINLAEARKLHIGEKQY